MTFTKNYLKFIEIIDEEVFWYDVGGRVLHFVGFLVTPNL